MLSSAIALLSFMYPIEGDVDQIILFRSIIPNFASIFFMYSLGIYFCIVLNLSNDKIKFIQLLEEKKKNIDTDNKKIDQNIDKNIGTNKQ